jgi:hypothetical protein
MDAAEMGLHSSRHLDARKINIEKVFASEAVPMLIEAQFTQYTHLLTDALVCTSLIYIIYPGPAGRRNLYLLRALS